MNNQTESPSLLSEHFTEEVTQLNRDALRHSNMAKDQAQKEIEDFKQKREERLKTDLHLLEQDERKKFEVCVDTYIAKLLKSIIPFVLLGKKHSREEDEGLILALNAYKDSYGYLCTVNTRLTKRASYVFATLYGANIGRWEKKFGYQKEIREPLQHFLGRIPHVTSVPNFSTLQSSKQQAKKSVSSDMVADTILRLLCGDLVLYAYMVEYDEVYVRKLFFMKTQKHEECAQCRDRENKIIADLFTKIRKLVPESIVDGDIVDHLHAILVSR